MWYRECQPILKPVMKSEGVVLGLGDLSLYDHGDVRLVMNGMKER